jgi:hypothetical protein
VTLVHLSQLLQGDGSTSHAWLNHASTDCHDKLVAAFLTNLKVRRLCIAAACIEPHGLLDAAVFAVQQCLENWW